MFVLRRYIFIFGAVLCLLSDSLYADRPKESRGKIKFSNRFQKKWGNHPIKVRQQIRSGGVSGELPSDKTVEECAERFYAALLYLPEDLIRKSGLKYVTFVRNLKLNNQSAGGVASGDTISLKVHFSDKTLFHEFFHIFDPHRHDRKWQNLNDKKFKYTGSKFYTVDMSKKERRQVKKTNRKDDIAEDFVSEYAMSFEWEDRAETFAHMIVEGRRFLKRTKNPVMKAKMEYIMELFIQRDLLDEAFWNRHFNQKFELKNRHYSNGSPRKNKLPNR